MRSRFLLAAAMSVPYTTALSEDLHTTLSLNPQMELLTEVNCTEKTMPTQKVRGRWWLLPSDRKGQERRPRASPKESRHRGWGLALRVGLTRRGCQAFPQHWSALLWSIGQGSWGARVRLEGSTTLGEGGQRGSGLLLQGIWESSAWW